MPGTRLTLRDRRVIAAGLHAGLGYGEIARRLARPTSTITREITRNGGPSDYEPDTAHRATKRRVRRRKPGTEAETGPSNRLEAVRAFEGQLAETLAATGLLGMPARVLAALLTADDDGMTAASLGRQLRISSASVSKAVGYLDEQGMIRRDRVPRRRTERYVVDTDAWFQGFLASAERNRRLADTARHGADLLGPTTSAGTRLNALSTFHEQLTNDIVERARHWRHLLSGSPPSGN